MAQPDPLVPNNPPVEGVAAISVKPPIFWKANPALWFCQLEAQFEYSRVLQDQTKYNITVMSMDSSVLSQVSDIVLNPPANNKYETLKRRLLERFADSDESRLKKLLTGMSLGDKKPSHFLREMQELAGNGLGIPMLKSLWLQHLPSQCQAILSVSNEDLESLAILADKIVEFSRPNDVFSIASKERRVSNSDGNGIERSLLDRIDFLCSKVAQIDELGRQVAKLSRSGSRSRPRNKSSNRGASVSADSASDDALCWYHATYGDKATKCKRLCKHFKVNSGN